MVAIISLISCSSSNTNIVATDSLKVTYKRDLIAKTEYEKDKQLFIINCTAFNGLRHADSQLLADLDSR